MFVKNVVISIGSMLIISCVLYIMTKWLGGDDATAKTLAGLPLLSVKNVYEFLERRQTSAQIRQMNADAVPMISEFAVPWFSLIPQGILAFMGYVLVSTGLTGFVIGFAAGFTHLTDLPKGFLQAASIPLYIAGLYLFGRWLGMRSGKYGFLYLVLIAVIANFILLEVDAVFVDDKYLLYHRKYASNEVLSIFLTSLRGTLFLILPVAFTGFYFGRRTRPARYFRFIMSVLPEETRSTLTSLAYEEARLIAQRKGGQPSGATGG